MIIFSYSGQKIKRNTITMNNYGIHLMFFLSVNLLILLGHVAGSKVLQIRGIPNAKSSLYPSDRDFQCLDGSLIIPFSHVNDNYCDCADGSDEPGTPACTNGSFYCKNSGHKSRYIPSTWVNDGVCDCCDASDEYSSGKECLNNCNELGKEARLEQQKAEELIREGNKIRLEMIAKGKQLKISYQAILVTLRSEYEEAELVRKEKEFLKIQTEELEKITLQKYNTPKIMQSIIVEDEEENLQMSDAAHYFKLIDADNNGVVTIAELQDRMTFDKDGNGVVTQQEAMYFLNNEKEVNLKTFVRLIWPNMKVFLMPEQEVSESQKGEGEEEGEIHEPVDETSEQENVDVDDTEAGEVACNEQQKAEESEVEYDEETQTVINAATIARKNFQMAEKSVNELLMEIRKFEEKLDRDFGIDSEFVALDGECFDYTNVEYIYTLCMFSRATQRSKSGGSDINLGHWNDWSGPEGQRYSKMKYDSGLNCWNGPARSTIVNLSCGKENKLVSVTEPSRCEYAMEFSTPVVCNANLVSANTHDEL